jgi:WD40 repeat protein
VQLVQKLTLPQHVDPFFSLCFSPDGSTLAAGSRDKTIKLWDGHAPFDLRAILAGASGAVRWIAFQQRADAAAAAAACGGTAAPGWLSAANSDSCLRLWSPSCWSGLPSDCAASAGGAGTRASVVSDPWLRGGDEFGAASDDNTAHEELGASKPHVTRMLAMDGRVESGCQIVAMQAEELAN